jgi:hypothetical protein
MPTAGSADSMGYALELVAATVPPEVPHQVGTPVIGNPDEQLLARFLIGYRDRTRAAYLADMRDFHAWCARAGIGLMGVHRSHIEAYIRQLEQAGRSRATVARRLATLGGFYRCAVQEGASPTPPSPTFVALRWRVIPRRLALTAKRRCGSWPRPRPLRPVTTPLPACLP